MKLEELKRWLPYIDTDEDAIYPMTYFDGEFMPDGAGEILRALPDLLAAVEALRDLLCEMSAPVWDDPRIRYHEVQITKGEVEKCRAILKRLGVE